MPNQLKVTAENSEELLNDGAYGAGAVIAIESSATSDGTYAALSGTGATPTIAIVAGTRIYTGYDPAGTSSTWYRTRYQNVGATRYSDWSTVFQVAPEGSGLLCSLYDVKQRRGIAASTTTDDESLLEYIGQVSAAIMGYTQRRFARNPAKGTALFTYDIDRYARQLIVPKGIAELSQLEYATMTGGTYTVIASTDYFLDPPESDRDYGWPATRITLSDQTGLRFYPGSRTVRATMAEGWASVPADIQGIAQRAVVGGYLAKGAGTANTAIVGPTGAMIVLRGISPEDVERLNWYKAPNV